jgi:hypothetical protein
MLLIKKHENFLTFKTPKWFSVFFTISTLNKGCKSRKRKKIPNENKYISKNLGKQLTMTFSIFDFEFVTILRK